MRNICLVTNYNYAEYLGDCLYSIALQTRTFDLIIIVDDGSTDSSKKIINAFCNDCKFSMSIFKSNGGQLSCFQAALEYINEDDWVFLIDSDDIYPPDYLDKIYSIITQNKVEFLFVNSVFFSKKEEVLPSAQISVEEPFQFWSTSALTRISTFWIWIGSETSALSMRGSVFHKLLPYPYVGDWRTRADDLLVFGASILGVHKLFVRSLGINYRVHLSNNFLGKKITLEEEVGWQLRRERLFCWYAKQSGIPLKAPLKNAIIESMAITHKLRKHFGIPSPLKILINKFITYRSIFELLFKHITVHYQ